MSRTSNRANTAAKVIPIDDEPFRFFVPSFVTPWVEYVCDLTHYDFSGSCTCEHFQFSVEPRLRKGERGPHLTCKHVQLAKVAAWEFVGPKIAAQMKKDREAKRGPDPVTPKKTVLIIKQPAILEKSMTGARIYRLRR
jgi:hypothetical protein